MSDILDKLQKHWQKHNVEPTIHKATPAEIAEWEQRHNVRLPDDLREYVTKINGFRGGESLDFDDDCFSFLPLSAMKPESEWTNHPAEVGRFVIVDYLIQSYWWCMRLDNKPHATTPVYFGGGRTPNDNKLVATSLEEFLALYIEHSPRLHL